MNNIKRLPPKQETVKMLLLRSGNQCYFPDCCHPIFNDKDDLIAECCHIEAAMPGGERFNPHQSEEDRRSIENLLFLCHEHHIETDNENIYTVEKLKEIKLNHENQFCEKPIHINPNYVQQVISKMQQLSHAIFETEETAKQILSILTPSSIFNIKELSHFFKYTEQIENYIPRKLLYDNRDDIIVYSYHAILTLSKKKPLRALIIADGGEGKTVYMSYLGNDSIKHNTYPIFVSLKDYIPQSQPLQTYIEGQHPDLSKVNKDHYNHLCFFLDGFDEIGDNGNAVKQINHFCSSNSEANIILSSRRNSYTNEFPNFQKYTLADLDNQDIKEYIKKYPGHDINTDKFFTQVYLNGFSNILYNPFYLNILIDSYVKHGYSLQNISKKDLIHDLLEKRIELDKNHSPYLQIDKPSHKRKIERYAKRLAFSMALMAKRSLSEKELASIIEDDFDLVILALPIRKGNVIENIIHWEFEHNIFLEHFAALVLEELPFEKVVEYTTSLNKVKTEWRDIIIHLLGIVDKSEDIFPALTSWLFDNDIDIFYKIEREQIDQSKREDIFYKIFSWYKEKCLWIDSFKVNIQDLASFGETRNSIYYIFDEICNDNNYQQIRVNAAKIFEKFKLEELRHEEKQILCEKYLEIVKSISPQQDYLLEQLIDAFPSKDLRLLDELIFTFKDTEFVRTRTSLFHVIRDNELEDKYVDFFLDAYSKSDMLPDGAHYGFYEENINQALCNVKESNSYIKIFSYLQQDYNLEYFIQHKQDVFNTIISNGVKYFNNTVFESFYCLFKVFLRDFHDNKDYFIPFFEKTQNREKAFRKSIEEIQTENQDYKYIQVTAIVWLLKDEYLPILFGSTLDKECFISLYYNLGKEHPLAGKIKVYLVNKYQFIEPERVNWNSIWEQRRKEDFNILFDKDWFCQECLEVFSLFNSDIIDKKQLLNSEMRGSDFYINNSVRSFLRSFGKKDILSKEKVSKWLDEETISLDKYLNKRIYLSLQHSKGIEEKLSKEQREYIVNWYNEILPKIDFRDACIVQKDGSGTFNDIAYDVIFYMQKLNLSCLDEILCDMLHLHSIHPYKIDFQFIVNKVKDKKLLNEKIIQNIREFYLTMYSDVLYPHIEYALKHKLEDIYPILISMLQDKGWNDINKKSYIIDKWINNDLNDGLLVSAMPFLSQYLQIDLTRNLYNKKQIVLTKNFIDEIIKSPEDEKNWLMAISVSIMLKDLKSLRLGIDWLRNNLDKQYTFIETQTSYTFPSNLSLHFDGLEALPYLFELLELSYEIKGYQPNYESIRNRCYENIKEIGVISEDFFKQTITIYEQYIEDKKYIFKSNVASLNYHLEDLKSKFWNDSYKPYSFRQACLINKEIFNDYIN